MKRKQPAFGFLFKAGLAALFTALLLLAAWFVPKTRATLLGCGGSEFPAGLRAPDGHPYRLQRGSLSRQGLDFSLSEASGSPEQVLAAGIYVSYHPLHVSQALGCLLPKGGLAVFRVSFAGKDRLEEWWIKIEREDYLPKGEGAWQRQGIREVALPELEKAFEESGPCGHFGKVDLGEPLAKIFDLYKDPRGLGPQQAKTLAELGLKQLTGETRDLGEKEWKKLLAGRSKFP